MINFNKNLKKRLLHDVKRKDKCQSTAKVYHANQTTLTRTVSFETKKIKSRLGEKCELNNRSTQVNFHRVHMYKAFEK